MTTTAVAPTIFGRAARVFDGWTDPDTGRRILRVFARNQPRTPGLWSTLYHQMPCFLDGGRRVLLWANRRKTEATTLLVDLATGEAEDIAPPGARITELNDRARTAAVVSRRSEGERAALWDLDAGRELAGLVPEDGWRHNAINLLSNGRGALVFHYRGKYYTERVQSRHYLIAPGDRPRLVLEADGYYCSHPQSCPADPSLYAYDRWPSPTRPIDQGLTIRSLDSGIEETVKLDAAALRPGDTWGARDHYVWTPDSRRIVSYLCPHPMTSVPHSPTASPEFNHYQFDWWISALDWRTGADLSAKYPPGRWGGHMQITPDSRYIVCPGGPGFDKIFAVELEALRNGWNEHVICSYPETISQGNNADPFSYPFVLPDGSGVIFTAGWPGEEHGVFLAEWPGSLR